MSVVEQTRRAEVDLLQIWAYVAERDFAAADRLWERLRNAINLLSLNPFMGESVGRRVLGIRQFSVGNHVVFFRPLLNGIRLLRVVHASRDIRSLIDELSMSP